MTENRMAEVAALFGKQLGERFTISKYGYKYEARFFSEGLETYGRVENPYVDVDPLMLMDLLTGEAEIVRE